MTDIYSLQVTPKLKQDLAEAAKWSRITAIAGFVSAGLTLLLNISRGSLIGSIITAALYALIYIYLLQFGKKMKAALQSNDQGEFLAGLKDLQTYFKICGVLLIIALALVVIFCLFLLVFGASRL